MLNKYIIESEMDRKILNNQNVKLNKRNVLIYHLILKEILKEISIPKQITWLETLMEASFYRIPIELPNLNNKLRYQLQFVRKFDEISFLPIACNQSLYLVS